MNTRDEGHQTEQETALLFLQLVSQCASYGKESSNFNSSSYLSCVVASHASPRAALVLVSLLQASPLVSPSGHKASLLATQKTTDQRQASNRVTALLLLLVAHTKRFGNATKSQATEQLVDAQTAKQAGDKAAQSKAVE